MNSGPFATALSKAAQAGLGVVRATTNAGREVSGSGFGVERPACSTTARLKDHDRCV
jgi:hypothetical protein